MSNAIGLFCESCGRKVPESEFEPKCPSCGACLEVKYDLRGIKEALSKKLYAKADKSLLEQWIDVFLLITLN